MESTLTCRASFEARFGDPQRGTQQSHVGPGISDSLLEGAQLHVVSGHIAQQRDQHGIEIHDRGVQAVAGVPGRLWVVGIIHTIGIVGHSDSMIQRNLRMAFDVATERNEIPFYIGAQLTIDARRSRP